MKRIMDGWKHLETITPRAVTMLLKQKIDLISRQPEFSWDKEIPRYARTDEGDANVKTAIAQCDLDFDLWKGLRNPAQIGLFPIGIPEIWDYYASIRKNNVDASGRKTIFQVNEPFESARKRYGRVLIITVMLPYANELMSEYNEMIKSNRKAPLDIFNKLYNETNQVLDKAVTRLSFDLVDETRAVVAMTSKAVEEMSGSIIPANRQGEQHGVCKGGNFPQKSIAVLTGLAQLGISRLVFRDELEDGKMKRFTGPVRSIFVFEEDSLSNSTANDILHLTEPWQKYVNALSDFTITDKEINSRRFCTYIPDSGGTGCGKCIRFCPSDALKSSSPLPSGKHRDSVLTQPHRFSDGKLQFNNGTCCNERGQLSRLYDEWMCGRCLTVCAAEGNRKPFIADLSIP